MRIAQVAPLAESVPPKLYGGTERVVAWLIEDLIALGHDVTLFAAGDSSTRATSCQLGRERFDLEDHGRTPWPHRRRSSSRWLNARAIST